MNTELSTEKKSLLLFGLALAFVVIPTQAEAVGILEPRAENDRTTRDIERDSDEGANDIQDRDDYSRSDIRDMVEDEFGDDHPMVAVARCESDFRQFDGSGDPLVNPISTATGIFQLLESYHEEPAEELGLSIFTVEGNIEYARRLYDSLGLQPWSPSSLCWDDGSISATNPGGSNSNLSAPINESTRVPVRARRGGDLVPIGGASVQNYGQESEETEQAAPVSDPVITKKLASGVRDNEVVKLQKLLNAIGFRLSLRGPGSPGEETNFFGAKTRAAVQEFQCENNIVCSGSTYTTGFGLVDAQTRRALNEEANRTSNRSDGDYVGGVRVRSERSNREREGVEDRQTDDAVNEPGMSDTNDLAAQIANLEAKVQALVAQVQ